MQLLEFFCVKQMVFKSVAQILDVSIVYYTEFIFKMFISYYSISEKIQELTTTQLAGCRVLSTVNFGPRGPRVIGSYETCCNASSINVAQSFFMQNHGNLSILLHPLTRYEVLDHTTRAMWLGKDMPLDVSALSHG